MPHAAPGVHEKVLELCGSLRTGMVLDAPAGPGALARALAGEGWIVRAFDSNAAYASTIPDIPYTHGDLDAALPFAAESFDCVTCVEGVEHIEDLYHLLRECRRVLKAEGRLIVTTPNILCLASRVKYFLFGSYRYFDSRINADRAGAAHIHPVSFPELEYALRKTGFVIERIETNRYLGACRAVRAILTRLFRCGNTLLNRAYNPALCTETLLFGEIVIVQARRYR